MRLVCELFAHWPLLLSLRRRHGRWTARCWLCHADLTLEHGTWTEPAPLPVRQPPKDLETAS